jgi:dipeptidase E
MKLFLSSIGLDEAISQEIDTLLLKPRKDISIGIVINAVKYRPPDELKKKLVEYTKFVSDLGYSNIHHIDIDSYIEKELKCDVLYIFGGNTFYLLDSIRRNHFESVLRRIIREDRIVVGQSAGSVIFSPGIEVASNDFCFDENIVKLKDLHALEVVDFAVLPHYDESYLEGLTRLRKRLKYSIVALKNGQTIYMNNDKTIYLGGTPTILP